MQKCPKKWCNFTQILLFKKGNKKDIMNYRGIALANAILKIFTNILAKRLGIWAENMGLLPEGQAGFRAGRSCEDNIFVLQAKISLTIQKERGKLFTTFVDFQRAFDSVHHGLLCQKLHKIGLSGQCIRIIRSIYENAKMKVKLQEGEFTDEIEITMGVLQGDSLSPILFILFLQDLVQFFETNGYKRIEEKGEIQLFADDLTVSGESAADLQRKLQTLSDYYEINKLNVNTNKTKIMIFQKGGKRKSCKSFKYRGKCIEIVDEYVYLGTLFHRSGNFSKTVNYFSTKAKIAIGTIWKPLIATKAEGWNSRQKLFDAVVTSTLLYNAGTWGLDYEEELEIVQSGFVKQMLGLSRRTPGYLLRLEINYSKLIVEVMKRALRLLVRIEKMEDTRLPKIFLINLMEDADKKYETKKKFNWFKKLRDRIIKIDPSKCVYNSEKGRMELKIKSESDIRNCLTKMRTLQFIEDRERAVKSRYCPIYKYIKVMKKPNAELYLNWKIPLKLTRLLAQLRMAGRIEWQLNIKLGYVYKFSDKEKCLMCNMDRNENLKHVLMDCPAYKECCSEIIRKYTLTELLNVYTVEGLKKLFNFVNNLVRIRAFCLCE